MKNYKVILFDLDGTLSDSQEGIVKSIQYSLKKLGIIEDDLLKLESSIGGSLADIYTKWYGLSPEIAQEGIRLYRERFEKEGIFENNLFYGVKDLLANLKDSGKILGLATAKPNIYAEQILIKEDIRKYFDVVVGADFNNNQKTKSDIIRLAIEAVSFDNKQDYIMVGDRYHDIVGANDNGIDSVAVTYGYGELAELTKAQPKMIVNSVAELTKVLLI